MLWVSLWAVGSLACAEGLRGRVRRERRRPRLLPQQYDEQCFSRWYVGELRTSLDVPDNETVLLYFDCGLTCYSSSTSWDQCVNSQRGIVIATSFKGGKPSGIDPALGGFAFSMGGMVTKGNWITWKCSWWKVGNSSETDVSPGAEKVCDVSYENSSCEKPTSIGMVKIQASWHRWMVTLKWPRPQTKMRPRNDECTTELRHGQWNLQVKGMTRGQHFHLFVKCELESWRPDSNTGETCKNKKLFNSRVRGMGDEWSEIGNPLIMVPQKDFLDWKCDFWQVDDLSSDETAANAKWISNVRYGHKSARSAEGWTFYGSFRSNVNWYGRVVTPVTGDYWGYLYNNLNWWY